MSAQITITWAVPVGYREGDYAQLHGNSGSGDIDWDTPVTAQKFELFPNRAGIYGYGHAPKGHHRKGHAWSTRTAGYGHLPKGHYPKGYGTVVIAAGVKVSECGTYKFGFACYDAAGNAHSGTPDEVSTEVHLAPAAPTGLKLNAYNKTSDILTLDVA